MTCYEQRIERINSDESLTHEQRLVVAFVAQSGHATEKQLTNNLCKPLEEIKPVLSHLALNGWVVWNGIHVTLGKKFAPGQQELLKNA